MTLTAMRPDCGRSKGREVPRLSVAQASASISAFRVVFQRFVRVVGAEKVGVADKEALFVVVGIDEPAGDAIGAVAAHLAGVGVEDVDAVDFHADLFVSSIQDGDVGLAEDDEQIAFAGVLEVTGHMEIGIHARLQDREAPALLELC